MRSPIAEQMLSAILKFDQRPLDVIIPLVPRFEREVLKASDCLLLRHRSNDHRGRKIECEVLRAAFSEEINRSVDKGRGPRMALSAGSRGALRPLALFCGESRNRTDWLPEGSEFEPAVPVYRTVRRQHHVRICDGRTNCPDRVPVAAESTARPRALPFHKS